MQQSFAVLLYDILSRLPRNGIDIRLIIILSLYNIVGIYTAADVVDTTDETFDIAVFQYLPSTCHNTTIRLRRPLNRGA